MIQADFYRSQSSEIHAVELTGHADSGPYGYDLVCAAVSALSIGLVNSLAELGGYEPEVKIADKTGGYLFVALPANLTQEQAQISAILLDSLLVSLRSVASEYSDYVTIIEHSN